MKWEKIFRRSGSVKVKQAQAARKAVKIERATAKRIEEIKQKNKETAITEIETATKELVKEEGAIFRNSLSEIRDDYKKALESEQSEYAFKKEQIRHKENELEDIKDDMLAVNCHIERLSAVVLTDYNAYERILSRLFHECNLLEAKKKKIEENLRACRAISRLIEKGQFKKALAVKIKQGQIESN